MRQKFSQIDPVQSVFIASIFFAGGSVIFFMAVLGSNTLLHLSFGKDTKEQRSALVKTRPDITSQDEAQLAANPTFQELVSYTDRGFEPTQLTMKIGDVVRFTDNATSSLWIVSTWSGGQQSYPGTSACSTNPIDSCAPLTRGDFYQFKFQYPGTYEVRNSLGSADRMSITVQ